MPAIAVDADTGVISASWFDTRSSGGSTALYDIYAATSKNIDGSPVSGRSFNPNIRISTTCDARTASFIGDYAGIGAGGGSSHPVWTNGGFNGGRLQTATFP